MGDHLSDPLPWSYGYASSGIPSCSHQQLAGSCGWMIIPHVSHLSKQHSQPPAIASLMVNGTCHLACNVHPENCLRFLCNPSVFGWTILRVGVKQSNSQTEEHTPTGTHHLFTNFRHLHPGLITNPSPTPHFHYRFFMIFPPINQKHTQATQRYPNNTSSPHPRRSPSLLLVDQETFCTAQGPFPLAVRFKGDEGVHHLGPAMSPLSLWPYGW